MVLQKTLKQIKKLDRYDNEIRNYDYYFVVGIFNFIVLDSVSTYLAITRLDAEEKNFIVKFLIDQFGLIGGLSVSKLIGFLIIFYAFYISIDPVFKFRLRDLIFKIPIIGSRLSEIDNRIDIHKARTLYACFLIVVGTFAFTWNTLQVILLT